MENGYEVRYIKTKNKIRKITTYSENDFGNREYHNKVVKYLRQNTKDSLFAKAYVKKASITKNAMAHMYNDIFIKLDIKDYFNSINHKYLADSLYHEINKNTTISYRECCEVVRKCSVSSKGLPLGLVSSPSLANIYLKEFDGLFYGFIKTLDLKNPIYTRYADDLVISYKGYESNEDANKRIIETASKLLGKFHLKLNTKKTRVVNIHTSSFVRITGVNIVKNDSNYRHLSVGNKLKNDMYWKILNAYDSPEKFSYQEISSMKGMLSFILSVEKRGFEDKYSEKMKQLLVDRGYSSLIDMSRVLDKRWKEVHDN